MLTESGDILPKNAEKKANAHLEGRTFQTPPGVIGAAADGDALQEDEGYTAG